MARTLRISPGTALLVVVVILAAVNVIDARVAHASLAVGPVCAAGLLAIARCAGPRDAAGRAPDQGAVIRAIPGKAEEGASLVWLATDDNAARGSPGTASPAVLSAGSLSWRDLGLGPGTWRRGVRWASVVIAAVALVLTVGAALPLTRELFRDSRYHLGLGSALLTAFVLIPVGTVLLEEVAFRGVLWGLVRHMRGTTAATVVSSALFGLWHILPSLALNSDNEAISGAVGTSTSGQVTTVLATVLFTAASGVIFCELRRRSGSILASAGLHWATNGLSVLASAAVWARGSR